MNPTGSAFLSPQPLVTRSDWVLMGLIGCCALFANGLMFLDGLYWGRWFLWAIAVHLIAFVMWVTMVMMPVINPIRDRLALRLVARAALAALACAPWILTFELIETPPHIAGCKYAFESCLTSSDFDSLRAYGARMRKENISFAEISDVRDLPTNFQRLHRLPPPRIEIRPYAQNTLIELDIYWGSGLVGYHGLSIDPESPPPIGFAEDGSGALRWHFKLGEGVYFFFSNG